MKTHICKICAFRYKEKKWADACYQWCKEHKSCNTGIVKHAVKQVKVKIEDE